MAELTKALAKIMKLTPDRENLLEEIVDVSIMLEQLKMIYGISDEEFQKEYDYKIRRLLKRLNDE